MAESFLNRFSKKLKKESDRVKEVDKKREETLIDPTDRARMEAIDKANKKENYSYKDGSPNYCQIMKKLKKAKK